MGVIWTGKTRTRQPIGWVPPNPAVRGEMVIAHDSQSLEVRNPRTGGIDGVFTTMSAEPAGPPFVYADPKAGLALDLTHDRAVLSSDIADTDSFSSLVFVNPYAGGLAAIRRWLTRGADGSGAGWSVWFGNDAAGKPILYLVLTSGGPTFYSVTGATTLPADAWTAVACVWDANSGSLRIYVNGKLDGTASTSGATTLRSSTVKLILGGDTDSTGGSYYGRRGPLFMVRRAWSDGEVARYSSNPWQLFARQRTPVFYSLGSPPASPTIGAIWTSKTRTRQPQTPLKPKGGGDQLVFLWNAAVPLFNLVDGSTAAVSGSRIEGPDGRVINALSSSGAASFSCMLPSTQYTLVVAWPASAASSGGGAIIRTSSGGFRTEPYTTGGGEYENMVHNGVDTTAAVGNFDTNTAWNYGCYVSVYTYDGATSKAVVALKNKTLFRFTPKALGMTPATGTLDVFAANSFGAGMMALSLSAVSEARANELALNPWQLFAPQRTPVFYSISGVSPGPSTANRIMLLRRPGLPRVWR